MDAPMILCIGLIVWLQDLLRLGKMVQKCIPRKRFLVYYNLYPLKSSRNPSKDEPFRMESSVSLLNNCCNLSWHFYITVVLVSWTHFELAVTFLICGLLIYSFCCDYVVIIWQSATLICNLITWRWGILDSDWSVVTFHGMLSLDIFFSRWKHLFSQ